MVFVIFNIIRAVLQGEAREPTAKKSRHIAFTNLDGTGVFQAFADAKISKCAICSIKLWLLIVIVGSNSNFAHPFDFHCLTNSVKNINLS